jgi:hypothetical protein
VRIRLGTFAPSLVLLGLGCSAGSATVDAYYDQDGGFVRVVCTAEGKNTFRFGSRNCDAPEGGECRIEIPVGELQGGWNRLPIETDRSIESDGGLVAEVHLGSGAFPRECVVDEVLGVRREDAAVELRCTFPDGYHGELWGEPLQGGRRRIPTSRIVSQAALDEANRDRWPTPDDPLLVVDVPVEVVNASGGRFSRPVRVAVPAPFVQFQLSGYERTWFERSVPLRLRAEAGAVITIDGKRVFPKREGEAFVVDRMIDSGENRIEIKAEMEGRVPSLHTVVIEGRWPESPLWIDEPTESEIVTEEGSLRFRGRTHPEAEVFWGRIPVPVGRDGTFTVDAYLEEGRNDVEISAFLAETEYGRLVRKPATRTFVVDRTLPSRSRRIPGAAPPQEELDPLSIGEVAESPWQTSGESVRFVMRADDVDLFPSERGCTASIDGVGCGREETRTAYIAFQDVQARTCVGERYPTFVEFDFCPKIEEGTWVEVEGTVRGGFAGRGDLQATVVRLRVQGTSVVPRARILGEEGG